MATVRGSGGILIAELYDTTYRLRPDGLVERLRRSRDRRAFLLRLTAAGVRCHREAEEVDRLALAEATAALDAGEREQFRALLARIGEHTL